MAGEAPEKASFPPVADEDTRLLILGSLPGEESLRRGQYYGHPRNQFWALMEPVAGQPLVGLGYEARLARLRDAGVGLWDVIASAKRSGSLDSAIREHSPNALPALIDRLPRLRAVAFNGATASAIGRKAIGERGGLALVTLPSSSPAHARLRLEEKQAQWRALRGFLAPQAT